MATTKKTIDWDLIEKDWRAGVKTKKQMSVEYEVSRAAMDKHFEKRGISRNLIVKIRAEAEAIVSKSVVKRAAPSAPGDDPGLAPATEREIVDANAAMQSDIILAHRTNIQRAHRLSMSLLAELEFQTDNEGMLQELAEQMYEPPQRGPNRRLELLEKVISLASRAGTMKTLADSLRGLIAMERQAFGLDKKEGDESGTGVEDVIARVRAKNGEG